MKLIDLANSLAMRLKGRAYSVDPRISSADLLFFARRRLLLLFRGGLRSFGFKAGSSRLIFVDNRVEFRNKRHIRVGRGVTIGQGCVLDGLSVNGLSIGADVSIGPYCIIEATGVITSLGLGCTIGQGSGLGAYSFIGAAGGVSIADNVIMGQRVSFHSENHNFGDSDVDIKFQGVTRKGIVVERNCWVGANVVFLDGAHVGEGCVIAAGSVVSGAYPPHSVLAGIPAVIKKPRTT